VVRRYAAGRRDVYDLTVADAHEFVASGVIVHNCWGVAELKGLSAGSWLAAYGTVRCERCETAYAETMGACPTCDPQAARKPRKPAPRSAEPQSFSGWMSAYGAVKCDNGHSYLAKRYKQCPRCQPGAGTSYPRAGGVR
jgi:hypothetical protein